MALLAAAADPRYAFLAQYAARLSDVPLFASEHHARAHALLAGAAAESRVAPHAVPFEIEVLCRARHAANIVSMPDALVLNADGSMSKFVVQRPHATPLVRFLETDMRVRSRLAILRALVEVHGLLAGAGLAPQQPSSLHGYVIVLQQNGTYSLLVEHTCLHLAEPRDDQIFYVRDLYALTVAMLFGGSSDALETAARTHADEALRAWLAAMFHTPTRAVAHASVFTHTLFDPAYVGAFLGEHVVAQ